MSAAGLQLEIFDTAVGRRRRDKGESAVLRAQSDWRALYVASIGRWFDSLSPGTTFTGEDLRHAALIAGIGRPIHHNAWSAGAAGLIRRWFKETKVELTGQTVLARSAKTHAHALRQYRKR